MLNNNTCIIIPSEKTTPVYWGYGFNRECHDDSIGHVTDYCAGDFCLDYNKLLCVKMNYTNINTRV